MHVSDHSFADDSLLFPSLMVAPSMGHVALSARGCTLQELKASMLLLRNTPRDELQQWWLGAKYIPSGYD